MSFRIITLAALMTCLVSCAQGQSLLIQYTFDEESGAAIDTGGGANSNGTLGPNTTRSSNTPGQVSSMALDLTAEGTESFVNGGDSAEVDTLASFTLTTWLFLEGLNGEQDGSGNVRLLAKQGPDPFDGFSWNLNSPNFGIRGTDNFRTGLFIGGESSFDFAFSSEDVYADEWAFLAVTYDGTLEEENTAFYFGDTEMEVVLLGDVAESIAAGPVNSTSGIADFGIGFTDAAPDVDFAAFGLMDDVRVYEGVLSLEQVEAVRLENLTVAPIPSCDPNTGGDINGDGQVTFPDFLILSDSFGQEVDSHAKGDINCDGTVSFPDFLILSDNFGTAGPAAQVPEPSGAILLVGWLSTLVMRRSRCISAALY